MNAEARATVDRSTHLRMSETYLSVQGESTHVGKPCVFLRLTGCNLRCTWCDTTFSFTGGVWRSIDDVVAEAHAFGVHCVEITGGEPLLQRGVIPLMERLLALGHEVLLETSGSRDIGPVPDGVHIILDLKPPDSGEERSNLWSNLALLRPKDEVKVVIASRHDYEWAREAIAQHDIASRCEVLLSPAWGHVEPRDLVAWMLEDHVPARFQLQLHKVVWGKDTQGV
jgi:7-carboxy-7-deazaguanine synthase